LALQREHGANAAAEVVFRGRLAINLANVGDDEAAISEGRAAAELADRIMGDVHPDRVAAHVNLASVLRQAGKSDDALAEIELGKALAVRAAGERSALYADILSIESGVRLERGDAAVAARLGRRSCEILAFVVGDQHLQTATCWADAAHALLADGAVTEAIQRATAALPIMRAQLGDDHAMVANTFLAIGDARLRRGEHAAAAAAFEDGRSRLTRSSVEPGFLASAEWGLAQSIVRREPRRARALVVAAVARWRESPGGWEGHLADAEAWLRQHR
jgi:hypothetical protein